ncbi:heavy metal translocating P-type ATPase [Ammoniphilus sp. CFH 90114]|uniref:heavy metal translocating P-type ATPase n=1 Tax=Ammoniphilus sp. CFH 90114 TaxID=2493665 RepID=UPI00100FBEB5|nr:heavy metal translocating P-type ATPase [Ammoniphilus sp. CFH 90114]RXT03905.1 cadmium-translocating P-type ATPase [Ammoniphilus sp. CFH 90114]
MSNHPKKDVCCDSGSCSEPIPLQFAVKSEPKDSCCSDDSCGDVQKPALQNLIDANGQLFEYRVQGMDCPACALTIEKSLGKMEGIHHVQVNYSTAKMQVFIDDATITDDIQTQIKKLGFSAEPLDTEGNSQTFLIEGMDCGACAVTLEKHMTHLPSVEEVSVNFSTSKMKLVHEMNVEEVLKEVSKAGFKATPVSKRKGRVEESTGKGEGTQLVTFTGILLALGFVGSYFDASPLLVTGLYAIVLVLTGYKPARSAFYAIKSGSLDMNVLMSGAAIGAAFIGEWLEGATVLWLFAFGVMLQNKSIEKTRDSIRNLMNLAPSEAWVKSGRELIRKPVEDVTVGDVIVIKAGEKIPLDGEILDGASSINQAPITGESIPVDKTIGDTVYAGTVNESGSLEVKVTKLVEDTTISRIIHLVEEAQEKKAPTQAFVDRFAQIYTPIVFGIAILIMIFPPILGWGTWGDWFYRALELLVVACPCALVISTPVAIVSAIGNAAKNGVLIKGGTFLEIAGDLHAIAFDKTGTLTEGKPKVSQVIRFEGTEEELLSIARTIEEHSKHPIAQAILNYAQEHNIPARSGKEFKAIVGKGAQATIDGTEYFAGNLKLFEEFNLSLSERKSQVQTLQKEGNTIVLIGTKTKLLGMIGVSDSIRDVTVRAISELKNIGVKQLVMLTGDNEGTAKKIAAQAHVDRYFAELLPEDKVAAMKKLQQEGRKVAMVGDGINDAPALATADLGIAMGGAGTDTAMETADIVLMADNLEKLPHTIHLSRQALRIIKQNIWFSLIVKFVALALIFPGWLTLWIAVMSDTGAALLVILNSMRLLRLKS